MSKSTFFTDFKKNSDKIEERFLHFLLSFQQIKFSLGNIGFRNLKKSLEKYMNSQNFHPNKMIKELESLKFVFKLEDFLKNLN
jgi:hypothetical protein